MKVQADSASHSRSAILAAAIALLLLSSCGLFGLKPKDEGVKQDIEITTFGVQKTKDPTTGAIDLDFSWATSVVPTAWEIWSSAASIDALVAGGQGSGLEGQYTLNYSSVDLTPRGEITYMLVARGDADDEERFFYALVNFGETGDPTDPVIEGASVDPSLWGSWHRLDFAQDLYIGDHGVGFAKTQYKPDSFALTAEVPNQGTDERIVLDFTDEVAHPDYDHWPWANLVITRLSEELLKAEVTLKTEPAYADGGGDFLLYRPKAERLSFSAKVIIDKATPEAYKRVRRLAGATSVSSRALGPATGVSLVIQNALNAANRYSDVTTDESGAFTIEGAIAGSDYVVKPVVSAGSGLAVVENGTVLTPLLDGADLGAVVISDQGYQLKASLPYSPAKGYGGAAGFILADGTTSYSLKLRLSNSGTLDSPATSVTLKPGAGSGIAFDGSVSRELSFAAVPSGAYLDADFSITVEPSALGGAEYKDVSIEIGINDDDDPESEWTDSAPLRVYRADTKRLYYAQYDSGLGHDLTALKAAGFDLTSLEYAPFYLSVMTPEGILVQPSFSTAAGGIDLPIREGSVYRLIVSSLESTGTADTPGRYSLCLGSAPDLPDGATAPAAVDFLNGGAVTLYANEEVAASLPADTTAIFELRFGEQADITELAASDPLDSGPLTLSWLAPDSDSFSIKRSLADGTGEVVLETAWTPQYAAGKISYADQSASAGLPYSYTVQGSVDGIGHTATASVAAYRASWVANTSLAARPAFMSASLKLDCAADTSNGALWFLSSAALEELDLGTGLPRRSLILPISSAQRIDLDASGNVWVFSAGELKASRLNRSSGSWDRSIDLSDVLDQGVALDFSYDSHRTALWFCRVTDQDLVAVSIDTVASQAPTSFDYGPVELGSAHYPRGVAVASDGRLFAWCSSSSYAGYSDAAYIVPVASELVAGSPWNTMPIDPSTGFAYEDSDNVDYSHLEWDAAGFLRFAIARSGSFVALGAFSAADGSIVAADAYSVDTTLPWAYHDFASVDGVLHAYGIGSNPVTVLDLRLSDRALRAFPRESGRMLSRLFVGTDQSVWGFDGENLSRWKSNGDFVEAFGAGGGLDFGENLAMGPGYSPSSGFGSLLALVKPESGDSYWMAALGSNDSSYQAGLYRLSLGGWRSPDALASFGYSGATYWRITSMVGGEKLFAYWQGDEKLKVYDSTAELFAAASTPAGSWGRSSDGSLLAAALGYSFDSAGRLSLGESSVSSYAASVLDLALASQRSLAGFGSIAALATIPALDPASYQFGGANGCELAVAGCYRSDQADYLLVRGQRRYESLSDGSFAYPRFSFFLRFDGDGTMSGFMGGSEEDYPSLGSWPSDFAVLSDGRLLVLRDGEIEVYAPRP